MILLKLWFVAIFRLYTPMSDIWSVASFRSKSVSLFMNSPLVGCSSVTVDGSCVSSTIFVKIVLSANHGADNVVFIFLFPLVFVSVIACVMYGNGMRILSPN